MPKKTRITQHLQYPFYHTILYDFFEKKSLEKILHELKNLDQPKLHPDDLHHTRLLKECKTEAICLDDIYRKDRSKSEILKATHQLTQLRLHEQGDSNPFLRFLPGTNEDVTFVQRYGDGSSYFPHEDNAVLVCLWVVRAQEHTGGEIVFTKYNYTPHLPPNSCLIFPPYELHRINEISSKIKNKPVRYSINRRFFTASGRRSNEWIKREFS